jgi:folylpolyglutamate synthase/dihydropteroate synthase
MKTFKQYLKENIEQEENFRDVFGNLSSDDWRNILKSLKNIIQNAFNYLDLEKMSEVHILDVSTYLMHKNYLSAIKYLYDMGYEPDSRRKDNSNDNDYQMYVNYLKHIKDHNVISGSVGLVFGQKVPNAYIPRPRISPTEEIEIKRTFKWLKERNEKDKEKIRSYWNSQFN